MVITYDLNNLINTEMDKDRLEQLILDYKLDYTSTFSHPEDIIGSPNSDGLNEKLEHDYRPFSERWKNVILNYTNKRVPTKKILLEMSPVQEAMMIYSLSSETLDKLERNLRMLSVEKNF